MAEIQNLRIDSLTPYENNPRINDRAVAGVVASIKQYGFIGAIIVNRDRVIINGHTRVKAMKELGAETIPAIVVDHLTPEQERALRIADNKTGEVAEWNEELLKAELKALEEAGFDMGALGFDTSELDELIGGTADAVSARPIRTKCPTRRKFRCRNLVKSIASERICFSAATPRSRRTSQRCTRPAKRTSGSPIRRTTWTTTARTDSRSGTIRWRTRSSARSCARLSRLQRKR